MGLLKGLKSSYSLFGSKGVGLTLKSRLMRVPIEIGISAPGMPYPIYLRLRTTDVSVFHEILLAGEYDYQTAVSPRTIVDAGANIGLASIFFANKYKDATIFAIEPEPSNFALLKKNIAPYRNIVPIQAALWKSESELVLTDPGTGKWGFQTDEAPCMGIERQVLRIRAITLDQLIREHRLSQIDILKIDIEGAEREVFQNACTWIGRVGVILVELHDRIKQGCSEAVGQAVRDFHQSFQNGETFCFAREEYGPVIRLTQRLNRPLRCAITQTNS